MTPIHRDRTPADATDAGGDWVSRFAAPPPRLRLAKLPTPVERLPVLDAPGRPVYVKRDDASSEAYGGGKVRKLEFVLARHPTGPCVSVGAVGSHHLLALAVFLARSGRKLHSWTFVQEPTPHAVRNLAALVSLQPLVWHVPRRVLLPLAALDYRWLRRPPAHAQWIPAGGSSPEGSFGFFVAALELAEQVRAGMLEAPRTVYVTAGTAGTAAGLALGFAAAGLAVHLRLVSAVERPLFNRWMMAQKVQALAAFVRGCAPGGDLADLVAPGVVSRLRARGVRWSVDHGQVGPGYGRTTPAAHEAVAAGTAHDLHLETTYTGKCFAAMRRDLAGAGRFTPPRGPVLFWNTHGATDVRRYIVPGWQDRLPAGLARWVRRVGGADLVR